MSKMINLKRKNYLYINRKFGAGLYRTKEGMPVWPVRNKTDLSVLTDVASAQNIQLEKTDSIKVSLSTGTGLVVCMRNNAQESAMLYAHLTGRNYAYVRSVMELKKLIFDVIVIKLSDLNFELLNVLYSNNNSDNIPGIICAKTSDDLVRQVLIKAATLRVYRQNNLQRVDIYATLSFRKVVKNNHVIIGNKASKHYITKILQTPKRLLSIHTHSDGVDAYLSNNLTLCPFASETKTNRPTQKLPQCSYTGICHRHEKQFDELVRNKNLVSPNEIVADILILDTCYGILLPGGHINPYVGLGFNLLSNSKIGAFVTTWMAILSSPKVVSSLADDIHNGTSVGKAIKKIHHEKKICELSYKLCLFGDPNMAISNKGKRAYHK